MTIRARYPGRCAKCGGAIKPGDEIDWDKATKRTEHVSCPEQSEQPEQIEASAPQTAGTKTYDIDGGSGYGCYGWEKGQIVRSSDRQRDRGYPEWLYVLSASRHYYRYDGMSFGVGDDSGYTYDATCREATPEEAAPHIAKREAALQAKAAKVRLGEIKRDIQQRGERPEASDDNAQGERMFDTQTAYGGGDWFVVNAAEIWYVRNNGADGDYWGVNNVRTGGAGAIGWRIPLDEAIVAELRELEKIISPAR